MDQTTTKGMVEHETSSSTVAVVVEHSNAATIITPADTYVAEFSTSDASKPAAVESVPAPVAVAEATEPAAPVAAPVTAASRCASTTTPPPRTPSPPPPQPNNTNKRSSNTALLFDDDGAPRSGIGAHLTPTKRRRLTADGQPTNHHWQGKCRICKNKSTLMCSVCADENHGKPVYLCGTRKGKSCFMEHLQACHNYHPSE